MTRIYIPEERKTVQMYMHEVDPNYPAQMRVGMDDRAVEDYAEAIKRGEALPMPLLVTGPDGCIPVDGHHRIEAIRKNGSDCFAAQVITTPDGVDAVEFARLLAVRFNNNHGVRKTRRDRRSEAMATIPLMHKLGMSNREIAHELSVDEKTIRNLKRELGITQTAVRDDKLARAVLHDFLAQDSSEVEAIAAQAEPLQHKSDEARPEFPAIPRQLSKALQVRVRQNKGRIGIDETGAVNLLMATAALLARMTPADACAVTNALYGLHMRSKA